MTTSQSESVMVAPRPTAGYGLHHNGFHTGFLAGSVRQRERLVPEELETKELAQVSCPLMGNLAKSCCSPGSESLTTCKWGLLGG